MLHFRTRPKPPPRSSLTRITDGLRFLGACGARTRSIIARRAYAFNHRSTGFERNSIACGTLARDAPKQGLKRRDGEEIAIYLQCIERERERKVAHGISWTEGRNEKWNNWNRPWAGSPLRFGSWTDWGSDGEVWACFFLCVELN